MMIPLKTIGILGLSPIVHISACRVATLFSQQDLRPQCFPANAHFGYIDQRASPRTSTLSKACSTAPHSFTYRIGASFSAKGRRFVPKTDHYTYEPAVRSQNKHNTGRPTSGQDAFFVSRIGNGSSVSLGVADGVGGWAESGIDPAHFSHGLCEQMIHVAENTEAAEEQAMGAEQILQKGYDGVVADESISGGGSTACVAVGRSDGRFEVAK